MLLVLQFKAALAKREVGEKEAAKQYKLRVRQTETLLLILNAVNTSAALLLPCFVIHWTQVSGRAVCPGAGLTARGGKAHGGGGGE